jgi:D-isomer specific 2-hydroxyacid dehydrogenase, NAD binding domain
MSQSYPYPLEVTRTLMDCARAAGFDFGEDTAIVAVQHMLRQTVDLFHGVTAMGVSPKNIFALGKIYSNNLSVMQTLRDLGVTVVDSTVPEPGEFHCFFLRDINTLWQVAAERLAERPIKRIIVLDDGGVCIVSVPPEILRRYAVCGVEQTTRGMVLFEETPPPFAVIAWARAGVKLEIAGPIFSQYLIEKVDSEFLRGSLQRDRIGIIGLGSIGRGVANLLHGQGTHVFFYDSNADVHVPASLRNKITRLQTLEELMLHCDCVLGCSGRNPFQDQWPMNHSPGIKLLSGSSGDQEFGPIIRDLKQKPHFNVASNTWDIISEHGPSGPIRIAYLGYPYSFVSRATEAVPTRIVQVDSGGLLAALIQARLFLELCEIGVEQNRGIHRVAPKAQRFIYERWAKTMKDRMIDVTERYGYDPYMLSAVQHDDWFIQTTEPHPNEHYRPVKSVENLMDQFVASSRLEIESEAHCGAL